MKPREKAILTVFVTVLLVVTVAIGADLYKKAVASINNNRWQVELENARISTLIENKDLWQQRQKWLDRNQPKLQSQDKADSELFAKVSAPPKGIDLVRAQLLEATDREHSIELGVQATVSGELASIFSWLHKIQSPEKFYVISKIKVYPEENTKVNVVCEFELSRWYQK